MRFACERIRRFAFHQLCDISRLFPCPLALFAFSLSAATATAASTAAATAAADALTAARRPFKYATNWCFSPKGTENPGGVPF